MKRAFIILLKVLAGILAFLFIPLALSEPSPGPSAAPAKLWKQKRREGYHIAGGKSRLRCGRNLIGPTDEFIEECGYWAY